jgi:hypothetical protein
VTIPTKRVEIFSMDLENMTKMNMENLKEWIITRIQQVSGGDFRQEKILSEWNQFFQKYQIKDDNGHNIEHNSIDVAMLRVKVSHGTYIRYPLSLPLSFSVVPIKIETITYQFSNHSKVKKYQLYILLL